MKSAILAGAVVLVVSSIAQAQMLATDCFDYNGLLTDHDWVNHSGSGKFIQADGSVATLDQSSGSGEDAHLPFTAQGATDTTYASFAFQVPSGNTVNPDGSGLYFAHFKDSSFAFRARTGLLSSGGGGGDFILAINGDNSNLGAGASWATELSFDTFYRVVISWNASTGEAKLWLNPASMASTSIAHTGSNSGDLMEAFALRQSDDYTGFIDIDGVIVGKAFADVSPTASVSYCTAGNSGSGCNAMMSSTGTASASAASGFMVTATSVEGASGTGMFYYGCNGRKASPWGNGSSLRCVVPPFRRAGLIAGTGTTGLCDGVFSQDFNALWTAAPHKNPGAGALVQTQLWYRDILNTSNMTTSFSDGLEYLVAP